MYWKLMTGLGRTLFNSGSLLQVYLYILFKSVYQRCIFYSYFNLPSTLFSQFCIVSSMRSYIRNTTSHGQQLPVLLAGGLRRGTHAIHRSQLSINSSLPPHHPLFSACSTEKAISPLFLKRRQTAFWIQTPEYDQQKLLLSSSGNRGNTSVPCLFTFPTWQKRSESEDDTARTKWNSMKTQQWKQYHPYFKQLAPNRGSLTLGCQLFYFSGFLQQTTVAQVYFPNKTIIFI